MKQAKLTAEGLVHDREYAVIKVSAGKVTALTQREVPTLAMIAPDLPTSDGITLHKEGMWSLHVPVRAADESLHNIEYHEWWDIVQGADQGDEAAAWLCKALDDTGLRLVRFHGSRATPDPEKFGSGLTLFSDGFGMLLTSEASLAAVENLSGIGLMAERMRPNVVVSGCAAYAEDNWSSVLWHKHGSSAEMLLPKPCARCTIPRVNPRTGIPGSDPLRYMKASRSGRELGKQAGRHKKHYENNKGEIFFGQNVNTVTSGEVLLQVGDILVPHPSTSS